MKQLLFLFAAFIFVFKAQSQNVGIGTNTPAAILEVSSTTDGILLPRLSNAQMNALVSPANGLMVTNTDSSNRIFIFTGVAWKGLGFTDEGNLTDTSLLVHKAGSEIISGDKSFFKNVLVNGVTIGIPYTDTTSTAIGRNALKAVTFGTNNTAIGEASLRFNIAGTANTALGNEALFSNSSGGLNVAEGYEALYSNTTGDFNTSGGTFSLYYSTIGKNNTAYGFGAANYLSDGATPLELTNNSVFLGYNTMAQADNQTNQIVIGSDAIGDGDNSTVIGNSAILSTKLHGNLRLPAYGLGSNTGTATFYLATDANGKIIEVAQGGGGSQWVTTGSDIFYSIGKVGIGTSTPAASALVDISSTTKGLLIPRMTTSQMNAITSPDAGLKVINTTDSSEYLYRGTTSGWQNTTVESKGNKPYTGTLLWTAGTPPSGTQILTYSWNKIGNLVTLRMNFSFSVAGTSVTQLFLDLPADMPKPFEPAGFTGPNKLLYTGAGSLTVVNSHFTALPSPFSQLVNDGGVYKIRLSRGAAAVQFAYVNIQYFTD